MLHNHYKLPLKTEDCVTENFQTEIIYPEFIRIRPMPATGPGPK